MNIYDKDFYAHSDKDRNLKQYLKCIEDLLANDKVKSMSKYIQHSDVNCLEHSLSVSYYSFIVCRYLHLDWRSAARGGLLHDLFLYDWHKPHPGRFHAFSHPSIALKNAEIFNLNKTEKDIIKKQMWTLTIIPQRDHESIIVSLVDKYCAFIESSGLRYAFPIFRFRGHLFGMNERYIRNMVIAQPDY